MQELISKEAVLELVKRYRGTIDTFENFDLAIIELPTTVHHEYKVGDMAEFSFNNKDWVTGLFGGYSLKISEWIFKDYPYIRPISAEHPDITQARELASKHGMILIPKE